MGKCKCYINHGKGNIEEIVQCDLCKAAPKLLAACRDFAFLEKTNMTKKQVQLRIEIAKEAIEAVRGME